MLSGFRENLYARIKDPAVVSLFALAVISFLVFYFFLNKTGIFLRALPVLGFAVVLFILLVPHRSTSFLAFFGLIAAVPFSSFAVLILGGQGVQWVHLFGLVLVVHMVAKALLGKRIVFAPATPWILAFLGASMISTLAILSQPDYHVTEFWKSEVQLLLCFIIFLAITNLNLKAKHLTTILKLMILLSVPIGLYGVYQLPARFFGLPGGMLGFTNPSMAHAVARLDLYNIFTRAASIFYEPSWFGHYMVRMLALSITAVLHNPNFFGRRWCFYLIIGLQIISLVFSRSVGAYFAFAELILLMFIIERGIYRYKIGLTIIWILAIGFLVTLAMQIVSGYPFLNDIFSRIYGVFMYVVHGDPNYTVAGESLQTRIDIARVGYRVWLDNPVIGTGLGQYTLVSPGYGNPHPAGMADSTLVATLAEMGITGIITLIGIAVSSLYGLRWAFRKYGISSVEKSSTDFESLKLSGRMIFYLILIEIVYFHYLGSLFWVSTWVHLALGGLAALTAVKYYSKNGL